MPYRSLNQRDSGTRDAEYYYRQRQQRRQRAECTPLSFEQVFSRDNLYQAFQRLKQENGPAPGIDYITYDDIGPVELGQLVGPLSNCVLNNTYKPYPIRLVSIPKPGKPEHRQLRLRIIMDRIVSKTLQLATQPLWERAFLPGSWGFRPQRCPLRMLADLEATMLQTDQWVMAIDDIRQAFDNVPISCTMKAHQRLINQQLIEPYDCDKLLSLIETVLLGDDATNDTGIDQGDPYSPTALNVLLQSAHDQPLEVSGTRWFRYADNLLYLVASISEGLEVLAHAGNLLNDVNLTLKGDPGRAIDLNCGETAELLGWNIHKQGNQLAYGLSDNATTELRQALEQSHETPNPHMTALAVTNGWVDAWGMAFEQAESLMDVIQEAAREHGFRELSLESVGSQWLAARERWFEYRREAMQRHNLDD